jgi:acylphosphatase
MNKTVALKISGKVQNVGFRYSTRKQAQALNISGFTKNESDGSVYVEASGTAEDIEKFVLWCHHGPAWARVDKVQISEIPYQNYSGFDIKL